MSYRNALQSRPGLITVCVTSTLLLLPSLAHTQQATPSASDQPQAEVVPRGQRSIMRQIKYGEWQKYCFKTPGTNQVCRTTISGNFDTGQSAVRADLIERAGEGKARLQLFLPVGLYLQAGVKLTIDQGKPHHIPYVWCLRIPVSPRMSPIPP